MDTSLIVCQSDKACEGFVLRDPTLGLRPGNDEVEAVCYQQGFAVHEVFQMCDVTSASLPQLSGAPLSKRELLTPSTSPTFAQTARSSTCSPTDRRRSPSRVTSPPRRVGSSSGSARSSRSTAAYPTAPRRSTSGSTATTRKSTANRWSARAFRARCCVGRTGVLVRFALAPSSGLETGRGF